jgi:hypothetical protein
MPKPITMEVIVDSAKLQEQLRHYVSALETLILSPEKFAETFNYCLKNGLIRLEK